jgi:hypothetical protein
MDGGYTFCDDCATELCSIVKRFVKFGSSEMTPFARSEAFRILDLIDPTLDISHEVVDSYDPDGGTIGGALLILDNISLGKRLIFEIPPKKAMLRVRWVELEHCSTHHFHTEISDNQIFSLFMLWNSKGS